jgi:hypothetical protein
MLPSVKRTLSSAMTKLEKVNKVILGVVTAAVVATGALTVSTDVQAAPTSSQFSSGAPVMLSTNIGEDRIAWHSSHSSHSSHESHYSHTSSRY